MDLFYRWYQVMVGLSLGLGLGLTGGAVSSFSPLDLPNLKLWLDASDASTITDISGAVSQWRDKSGLDNHADQSVEKPTTDARTVNGLNAMNFDVGEHMDGAVLGLGDYTKIVAFVRDDNTEQQNTVSNVNGNSNGDAFWGQNTNKLNLYDNASSRITGIDVLATATPYIGIEVNTGAGADIYLNGLIQGSATYNNVTGSSIYHLGSHSTATGTLNGLLLEIVVCEGILSTENLNIVGNYLADKWGV